MVTLTFAWKKRMRTVFVKTLKNEIVKNLWEDGASLLLSDMIEESLVDFLVVSGLMGLMTLTADLTSGLGEDP